MGDAKDDDAAPHPRVLTREEMTRISAELRAAGKVVVFTNGCFDLLHIGHVQLLERARALGDVLVVGLNGDASLRRLKGETRPLVAEGDRARILAGLRSVDYVVVFDEDTPLELLAHVRPHVLAKGGDYRPEEIIGRDLVQSFGGRVEVLRFLEGRSTTNLVAKIRGLPGPGLLDSPGINHKTAAMSSGGTTVLFAADHNGVAFKAVARAALREAGYHTIDLGPYEGTGSVDYVNYARQLGTIIKSGDAEKGILICGTGVGMSIAANKVEGVRAALVHNIVSARKSREHNDSNVLCLGSSINPDDLNLDIMMTWLSEKFGEYRHVKRIAKIDPHSRERIVFTSGFFDILHAGHIECLKFAKSLGGRLVVGINDDRSIRELKGEGRPVTSERDRKAILQSIKHVDEVVIFEGTTPAKIIRELNPNVIVKGGEFTADQIRERDSIPPEIEIKIFPLMPGFSSTNIVKTIRTT